jgi:8-oxo-dGTP pyrophosphatase MutT (NUDIX family)
MGAGVLPTTIHNGKLYFLFGKEGKSEDSAPGFSDFGGGTDHKETFFQTAIREAGEEFTGFLGTDNEVKKLLTKNKTYNIDYTSNTNHGTYRMHIFPFEYNEWLPLYYNNNQQFLQKHLSPEVFKKNKIFEKAEIKWICVDDIKRMRPKFRSYFQNIVDMILAQKEDIISFIKKRRIYPKNTKKKRLSSNKTRRIQK